MKKIALVAALPFALTLAACGEKAEEAAPAEDTAATEALPEAAPAAEVTDAATAEAAPAAEAADAATAEAAPAAEETPAAE